MNQRRHLTFVAAIATLMASAPLSVIFTTWTWIIQATLVVALICAAALAARALRAPVWAQPLATLVALLFGITWLNADGHAFGGVIPTIDTFRHFGVLLSQAGADMSTYGIPVDARPDFLLLAVAGVGIVAVLVDLLAVGLRRPALAGLPMLAIYAVPVEVDPHNLSIIPFAIGAAGFMWLLVTDNIDRVRMFGRRFTGEGRGVDMWEPSPLAGVGRRIAVVGVLLAIVIPFATPGLTTALIPQLGGGAGGDGSSTCKGDCPGATSVNLFATLQGFLNKTSTKNMVTVTTNAQVPEYLRLGVASILTPKGFQPSSPSGQAVSKGLPDSHTNNGAPSQDIKYNQYHASIAINDLSLNRLPLYVAPLTGTLKGISDSWGFDPDTAEVFGNSKGTFTKQGMSYSFDYREPDYSADELRTAPQLAPNDPILSAFGRTPSAVKEVVTVVNQQTAGLSNEYDKVDALYNYFSVRNHFQYQLSTKAGTTGSDIGDFLQNKQGYCVQYAAALAWLVRQAGYPSRVAFGFVEGIQQPGATGTYIETSKDLHAWTEVYFQNFGWVPFDATPQLGGTIYPKWAPNPNTAGSTTPLPASSASGNGSDIGGAKRPTAVRPEPGGPNSVAGADAGTPAWIKWVLVGLLVALVLAALPAVARVLLRNRRAAADRRITADPSDPGDPWVIVDGGSGESNARRGVHAAWDEFIDTLVDYGLRVDAAETPRSTTERVVGAVALPDDIVTQLRLLGSSEERARYARRPGPSQSFDRGLRSFRRSLGSLVSTRTRLRALLLPPSMTNRWRARAIGAMSDASALVQSMGETLTRVFSLRRLVARNR